MNINKDNIFDAFSFENHATSTDKQTGIKSVAVTQVAADDFKKTALGAEIATLFDDASEQRINNLAIVGNVGKLEINGVEVSVDLGRLFIYTVLAQPVEITAALFADLSKGIVASKRNDKVILPIIENPLLTEGLHILQAQSEELQAFCDPADLLDRLQAVEKAKTYPIGPFDLKKPPFVEHIQNMLAKAAQEKAQAEQAGLIKAIKFALTAESVFVGQKTHVTDNEIILEILPASAERFAANEQVLLEKLRSLQLPGTFTIEYDRNRLNSIIGAILTYAK